MKFQINKINKGHIQVEVFDKDKTVLVQDFEITPERDLDEIKRLIHILIKKQNNINDFKSKVGKKLNL